MAKKKVYLRMEQAPACHNEHGRCYFENGEWCNAKDEHREQCASRDIIFIEDTIIPQKLELYPVMMAEMKEIEYAMVHFPDAPLAAYSRDRLQSIIDRAKKIEEE